MKKFTFYYIDNTGANSVFETRASNQGVAIANFKRNVEAYRKILNITKTK